MCNSGCLVNWSMLLTIHSYVGGACRARVFRKLCLEFASPVEADQHFHALDPPIQQLQSTVTTAESQGSVPADTTAEQHSHEPDVPVQHASAPPEATVDSESSSGDTVLSVCHQALGTLHPHQQLEILSMLFSRILSLEYATPTVPPDFLQLVASGMQHLHGAGRSNTIYLLAKALGTIRSDGSDSLMPVKRMPMGLIEYAINFFTASSVQKVSAG